MRFQIELEREEDGRWIAEVPELPGVMVYGPERATAVARVQALALRVLAERLEHGEWVPEPLSISFLAAHASGPREP
ncbi:MAG TPA: type II toxin-antitoxin system HicB family antitoxin [Longimicrobium sp.]